MMTIKRQRIIVPILAMLFSLLFVNDLVACPNCKNGLDVNFQAIAFGASVLLMMSMPFALMAGWVLIAVKSAKTKTTV